MTEQPDTAAIRACLPKDRFRADDCILALCAALDSAREERDCQSAFCAGGYEAARIATARAEAAEAELDKVSQDALFLDRDYYKERCEAAEAMRDTHAADVTDLANKHARALDRAEAAEARIAAAVLVCCNYEWCGDGMECEVRRALTEGTGQ